MEHRPAARELACESGRVFGSIDRLEHEGVEHQRWDERGQLAAAAGAGHRGCDDLERVVQFVTDQMPLAQAVPAVLVERRDLGAEPVGEDGQLADALWRCGLGAAERGAEHARS